MCSNRQRNPTFGTFPKTYSITRPSFGTFYFRLKTCSAQLKRGLKTVGSPSHSAPTNESSTYRDRRRNRQAKTLPSPLPAPLLPRPLDRKKFPLTEPFASLISPGGKKFEYYF